MKYHALLCSVCLLCSVLAAVAVGGGNINIVGGLTRYTKMKPNEKIDGSIVVRNTGTESQEVKVLQTDYLFYADGRNDYGIPGSHPRSNAKWITFTPQQFTVPAQGIITVNYTIQAPNDAKLTGTYWSMFMVEPLASASLEPPTSEKEKIKVGVRTVLRYGIQIITDCSDNAVCSIKFTGQQLQKLEGKTTLIVDVENNGEQYLTPTLWTELFDEQGTSLGRFDGGHLRIYPTCSGRFRVDLSRISAGTYSALVVADNGDDHVFGAQLKLEIK